MICTAAVQSFLTVVMNMAGVEASPQSYNVTPAADKTPQTALLMRSAEILESLPIYTVISEGASPVFSDRYCRNPYVIFRTASSVSEASSPTAVPLISVPLLRERRDIFFPPVEGIRDCRPSAVSR